jgi:hypothetical protein
MNNPFQELTAALLLALFAYFFVVFFMLEGGPH